MIHIHAADLFFALLKKAGVKRIYGIPGDELEIFDALAYSGIQFITTRHEQAAAFMAQGEAKMSGRIGICISTLGPGATNLATAIADAYQNRVPLLALSGQLGKEFHKPPLAHQFIDLEKLFRPITKATFSIRNADQLEQVIQQAIDTALMPKPGPVHVSLPIDVMEEIINPARLKNHLLLDGRPRVKISSQNLKQAIRLLKTSSYPVAFFGEISQRFDPAFVKALVKAKIPVMTSFLGKGGFPESNDWSLGVVSRHVKDALASVIERADLFLVCGYDYIEGVSPSIFAGKRIINIDIITAAADGLLKADEEALGDPFLLTGRLAALINMNTVDSDWDVSEIIPLRQARLRQIIQPDSRSAFPYNPFRVMQILQEVTAGNEIIVSDVGVHKQVIALGYNTDRPLGVHFSNGLSSMGFSLPFAAGARFNCPPSRTIISINGDGGFLMNMQDLETIRRYNLDVKIIVFVDNAFGMIKANLLQKYNRAKFLNFDNPEFGALARSFGIRYLRPGRSDADLRHKLKLLLHTKGPILLPIPVKY